MPKLYMHALGCKTNHYENQALAQQLLKHGFSLVENMSEADVGILNTCTVTAEAGRKSRQFLRRMKHHNPDMIVAAMGCYTQLEDLSSDCDLVIGTSNRNSVFDLLNKKWAEKQGIIKTQDAPVFWQNPEDEDFDVALEEDLLPLGHASTEAYYEELGIVEKQEDTRAQIKIEDGCNAFCTYCAIPLARGRVRSRKRENILKEASLLAQNGHKEIVLTGIHICSFEKESGRNSDALAELCLELNGIQGLERIRLGSLEPLSVSESFLEILSGANKVCPQFHLSLQSGSDSVLKRMRRHYSSAEYRERVDLIRSIYELPAITTDVMVGFPEETSQEFSQSLSFVEEMALSRLHVFPYSIRPGTAASRMRQVDGNVVKERASKMLEMADVLAERYASMFVGKRLSVLFEDRADGYSRGYTSRYLRVHVKEQDGLSGQIKQVLIKTSQKGELFGDVIW